MLKQKKKQFEDAAQQAAIESTQVWLVSGMCWRLQRIANWFCCMDGQKDAMQKMSFFAQRTIQIYSSLLVVYGIKWSTRI